MRSFHSVSIFSMFMGVGLMFAGMLGMLFEPHSMNSSIMVVGLCSVFFGYTIKHYKLI
jgi:hypothetical protein